MKRILPAMALIALLVGCGSAVKLDEVAVEDKSGAPISGQGSGVASSSSGNAGQQANSAIAPVDLSKSSSSAANPSGQRIVYFDYDST